MGVLSAELSAYRRLYAFATGLLVAMAALFLFARFIGEGQGIWGYVQAFAEAAMVGGLADWFAVTALFRHPLGLPIPHTAIIPQNKDRIGDTLAQFLHENFLTPIVVARRMGNIDVAGAAARFLAQPGGAINGRLRQSLSRFLSELLQALDLVRLGDMAKGAIARKIGELNIGPLLGQAMGAALAQGRFAPVLDAAFAWVGRALQANEEMIREMISEKSGGLLKLLGLDEKLANAILDGLLSLLTDMQANPDHPMRAKIQQGLEDFALKLQTDAALAAKVAQLRDEMIANPAMQAWIDGMWQQACDALIRAARDPQASLAGRFGSLLREGGEAILADPVLASALNRFVRRSVVAATATYGHAIVRLVSDTIKSWDANTVTERLEGAVGRDLQYIRINGTLVGGLVGVLLHAVQELL